MSSPVQETPGPDDHLARSGRGLSNRHVVFIALGGAIGAGFFLGSGLTIKQTGPGMLLAYAISGAMIFLMARALGEMTLNQPAAGSFSAYAERYLGPWCGFVTGWAYWLIWVLAGAAEITAVGIMMRYWLPDLPQWLPALVALVLLYAVNLLRVRVFGELEFWLSVLKVSTIVLLIVVGGVMIAFGVGPTEPKPSLSNLWSHEGFLPSGISGLVLALPIALFAFGGTELIGLTAAEAEKPETAVPRAINGVVVRMLIFYVGAMVVILAMVPWEQLGSGQSPFVLAVARMGLPAAATFINFVAISAVVSSCNSGIFACGNMLRALGSQGQAPSWVTRIGANGRPRLAITASAALMLVGVLLNYLVPERALEYAMQSITLLLLWVWLVIVISHSRYRRQRFVARPAFPMPGSPLTNWLAIGFFTSIVLIQILDARSRVAVIAGLVVLALLGVAYVMTRRR
jgi:amino acid transporter, AAT family